MSIVGHGIARYTVGSTQTITQPSTGDPADRVYPLFEKGGNRADSFPRAHSAAGFRIAWGLDDQIDAATANAEDLEHVSADELPKPFDPPLVGPNKLRATHLSVTADGNTPITWEMIF